MRKAIITTLSVLIVLLSIACNTRVNYNKYLIAIDSLIVQQPDTALSMLEAFPTNSLQTQADSAYYGLLMTEARDKNYIIQTNDSLIQSALTYYNGTNDIEKRARAHYYSGCVYRDSQRRTESMTQYLIAKPLAEKAGERRLLSLIYLNIGYLYYSQNLNTQADSSYQLAQQIGIQLKDSVLQAEVLSRRGLIRMEKERNSIPKPKNDVEGTPYRPKTVQHTIKRKCVLLTMPTIQLDGKRRESYRIRQTESWRTERPHNMLQSFRTTWKRILPNIAI